MSPSFLEQLTAAHIATGVAVAACTFAFGYQAGLRSLSKPSISESKDIVPETLAHEEEGSDSEDEQAADGDLSSVKAGWVEPCKLALVVRTDLGMSSGKIAAQCGHATLACYKALVKVNPNLVRHWERTGQAKIALKVSSEDQLEELEAVAKSLNLCARAIHDAGRTEVAAGSRTVLGIGPGPVEIINKVTGKLRLL